MNAAGFLAGFGTGRRRAQAPRALFITGFALVLAALVAVAERRIEWFGATSRALSGIVFGLLLPVALVATSGQVLFPLRLATSASFFARFGASRRAVALGLVMASMGTAAILAAAMGAVTALIAHDPTAPPAGVDALTTAWIGLLTGAAYAALFALGSTFGARGGGRYWALVLDFALGAGGVTSVLVPRAHAQNLLGGAPPLMWSQPASAAALLAIAVVMTLLALARLPP
jgi:hypothetical protein